VHAPNAVVDGPHARIVLPDWDVPDYLGAEPVVAEEDVADPGHQHAPGQSGRLGHDDAPATAATVSSHSTW
jgi:hypothetical protein